MPMTTIFYIEDSPVERKIVETILKPHYTVITSTNGLEALQKGKEIIPHLVLTDLNMPDITGIEFSKEVRQWFTKDELPIIMVTTQSEARDNKAAHEAGVNAIIQKPFTEGQIGDILTKFSR